jgi:MocE subfamily Rieske [2Fe-2S] domain protein
MNEASSPNWVRVAAASDLAEGEVMAVEAGGESIALYRLEDGAIYATDDICTHEFARLSEGWLEDGEIECPLHAGRFDVRTGAALCPPVEKDLRTYPVRVEGDDVFVDLSAAARP